MQKPDGCDISQVLTGPFAGTQLMGARVQREAQKLLSQAIQGECQFETGESSAGADAELFHLAHQGRKRNAQAAGGCALIAAGGVQNAFNVKPGCLAQGLRVVGS